jgi:hypothetical protein
MEITDTNIDRHFLNLKGFVLRLIEPLFPTLNDRYFFEDMDFFLFQEFFQPLVR